MSDAIVLCGCSGAVGRMLVARLAPRSRLILVGRDPVRLAAMFPGFEVVDYGSFEAAAVSAELVVNLAAKNNDSAGCLDDFLAVNRDFALELARRCRSAGSARFVNLSSFHAIGQAKGYYAQSKAAGERALLDATDISTLVLRIPAIHGEEGTGNLARIHRMPKFLRRPIFLILAALKPTLSVDRLANFLIEEAPDWPDGIAELADDQTANPVFSATKRIIDIGFSLSVIVLLWWLAAIVWTIIRLESEGPGIFRQVRVGQGGKPFVCYKFRTMAVGTRQSATHEVSALAVTRAGRWLRRTKIDELPQVVNLLRNELSLVGPRPCLPMQEELVRERVLRGVDAVKPGITGLAQVKDIDMGTPRLLAQWDRRYAMTRCLPLELKLILATFIGRGQGDRVGS